MIRAMSSSPLSEDDMIPSESKFKGEAYEIKDNRTVFVGSMEDSRQREDRVVLLVGPSGADKWTLIDFFCNYFYGVRAESDVRYRIANEKFDVTSPERPIVTYIFNDALMDYRPIIVDTPGTGKKIGINDVSTLLIKWFGMNKKMRLDAIGIVFSDINRMTSAEEDELQKIIKNLPAHVRSNIVVFVTGCDGSAPQVTSSILQRFGLHECQLFKINSACLYEKPQSDSIKEQLRLNYWKNSIEMFDEVSNKIKNGTPVTISGEPVETLQSSASADAAHQPSPRSSTSSQATIIAAASHAVPIPSILAPIPPPAPLLPPPPIPVEFPPSDSSIPIPEIASAAQVEPQPEAKRAKIDSELEEVLPVPPPGASAAAAADTTSIRTSNYDYPTFPEQTSLSASQTDIAKRRSLIRETHIIETRETSSERQRLLPAPAQPAIGMASANRPTVETDVRRSIFYSPYSSASAYMRPSLAPPLPPHQPIYGDTAVHTQSETALNIQDTGTGAVADTVHTYRDETTPPPLQHTDIANTYSTTSITYVNNDHPRPEMIKTSYSPRTLKKETNSGLKDAMRLSREELRVVENTSDEAEATTGVRYRQPLTPVQPPSLPASTVPIGRGVTPRGATVSAGGTIIGAGAEPPRNIMRYAYDNDRHTYRPHAGSTAGDTRMSRRIERAAERRWSSSEAPRTETLIDDPAHDLGGRDIVRGYGTVEIRRSKQSLASQKSSHHGSMPELVHSEDMTHVQEKIPYKERVIDFPISQSKSTFDRDVQIRKSMRQSGGHVADGGGGAREVAINVHVTPKTNGQQTGMTAHGPATGQRYENAPGQPPIPRYDEVSSYGYAQPQRTDYVITPARGTASPIQGQYAQQQQQHVYRDSDYGSNWDDKSKNGGQGKVLATTTTDISRKGQHTKSSDKRTEYQQQYPTYQPIQHSRPPISLPDPNDAEKGLIRDKNGAYSSRDEQYYSSARQPTKERSKKSAKSSKSKSKSSSREATTRIRFLNWTPSNWSDPYNCCLNFLYFVVAPLVLLAIIITVIVLVIFQH